MTCTTDDLHNGNLSQVVWSIDGQIFFAGGRYASDTGGFQVLAWDHAGRGKRRALSACGNVDSVMGLASLPTGRLMVATAHPCIAVLEPDGSVHWAHGKPGADFRDQQGTLAVSADG